MDTSNMIFVFGSNLAGIHGAGAAQYASRHRGAEWGKGVGLTGQSYGIPTKDRNIYTLPFFKVRQHIEQFIEFARMNPKAQFQVTCIDCGLAGFANATIAPLFNDAPSNCFFDEAWRPWLNLDKQYWGTF